MPPRILASLAYGNGLQYILQICLSIGQLLWLIARWMMTRLRFCRPLADADPAQLIQNAGTKAINASVKRLNAFLTQFQSISASPMTTSVADWKERLSTVHTTEDLISATLDLEADINDLGTGLPTGMVVREC